MGVDRHITRSFLAPPVQEIAGFIFCEINPGWQGEGDGDDDAKRNKATKSKKSSRSSSKQSVDFTATNEKDLNKCNERL